MSKAVDELKRWFANLDAAEKREVVKFLYGGDRLEEDRATGSIKAGREFRMYVGPAPSGGFCSQCGSPL